MKNRDIVVSISCITYNHAPYIRQCLDGFMMQQTDFAFEILIHDDASTDGTAEIIKEYEAKYPDIIKPIYEEENQWMKGRRGSAVFNFPRAKGKYIAMCEGDDYWTDPLKLQKQVNFLESNPDYSVCSHCYQAYDHESKRLCGGVQSLLNVEYDITDLLKGRWYFQTLTLLFRRSELDLNLYSLYPISMDAILIYHLLRKSKGILLRDNMSVYRCHKGGVWSKIGLDNQRVKEFYARLGVCEIEQDLRSAQFLKTQFFKPMSRKWMFRNRLLIFQSLKIIYDYMGILSVIKCVIKSVLISTP